MNRFNISVNLKSLPPLDEEFIPILLFNREFIKQAKKPLRVAVERADGQIADCQTRICGTPEMAEADRFYVNRLVKTLLWVKGGFRIYVSGSDEIYEYLKKAFSKDGVQAFDYGFMADVYEHPFEVVNGVAPKSKEIKKEMGGHLSGCRIGFDAGGSDRKVSAVIDGKTVFSEEVVWFPKTNSDPQYHYDGIVSALKTAAAHLPRVDGVGVSSAGVFINNRVMKASLFLKVPREQFDDKVKDIYIRAIEDTFGKVPYAVINDGDVSALAGAITYGENNILGIAMGTSEAGGYVDDAGCITGWLNELAFVPVDVQEKGAFDEWSGDIGCGVKYFSQDAVIRLAPRAGITLDEGLSPAEKLKVVQVLMEDGDSRAERIYQTVGVYLGHTLAFYQSLYGCHRVLLLGRVMSGKGGDLILEVAKRVLKDEYPEIDIKPSLPDEKFRRVGQSMAAAALPEVK